MISSIKSKGLISFLLVLVVIIGYLSYQNAKDYSHLRQAFEVEKNELESELDVIIKDYQDAISRRENVSSRLKEELNKIIKLRDTIQNLKSSSYSLITDYRKRIVNLERQNKSLFIQIDSLSDHNSRLLEENVEVKEELEKEEDLNDNLNKKNKVLTYRKNELQARVANAEILKAVDLDVEAMKKKRSGKYTSTSRSSKTEAFEVTFELLENKVATKGKKDVHFQLINPEGKLHQSKGKIRLKNRKVISYSEKFQTNYENKNLEVKAYIYVDNKNITKGEYIINVFIDRVYSGYVKVKLR
ncbi:hypothetical protein WH52_04475 [Tenacibaculum holothuriorum]|uniref:Chromosome partitioning protein ParA n=1 Tax=Tenacibaculum holothuriorum TaxID=1635173 RepID=A0A1Y2PEQ9_9FLAO|nr:hypothetical protein [Tenacibaculum holothuriorum]OSY88925.1 hypothetical protein WH52_04475 [Tenacibaculum holothuriorum]